MDIGWTELLVIGVVALIVVGPKDLPGMFRALGKYTAKMKRMAREFQRAMEDAADESGMKETASDLRNMANPKKMGLDALKDAAKDATGNLDDWDPTKPSEKAKGIGPETAKLAEDRAEAARKARDNANANAAKWTKPEAEAELTPEPDGDTPKAAPKPKAAAKPKPKAKPKAKPKPKPKPETGA